MTVTRSQFIVLLEPGVSNIWFDAAEKKPVQWTRYYNIRSTRKATVTDRNMTGFGPLRLKGEAENIIFDDPINGNVKTYQPIRKALGYSISQEMVDHELYGVVNQWEGSLMDSAYDDLEVQGALVFNNGFGTTNADGFTATGFDGLALFSTAHTRLDGGATQRNRPSTDVDLSVTGLQQCSIDFDNWLSHRGRPVMIRPKTLIVNPEDKFTAKEILQSEYKFGTANNEVNALKDEGISFQVSNYIDDADAWFVLGDRHDLNFIWDVKTRGGMWEDEKAEVIYRKVVQGYANSHGEWYGTWGTTGA